MHDRDPLFSRYLINIKVGISDSNPNRNRKVFSGVAIALKDISGGKCQLAYQSRECDVFGFLVKTSLSQKDILVTIDRLTGDTIGSSLILKEDQYMVLLLSGGGFSKGYGR